MFESHNFRTWELLRHWHHTFFWISSTVRCLLPSCFYPNNNLSHSHHCKTRTFLWPPIKTWSVISAQDAHQTGQVHLHPTNSVRTTQPKTIIYIWWECSDPPRNRRLGPVLGCVQLCVNKLPSTIKLSWCLLFDSKLVLNLCLIYERSGDNSVTVKSMLTAVVNG